MIGIENSVETQPELEHDVLKGAFAGFVATIPMTLFMLTTQRFLPKGQHYDLPPELITKDLARRAHVRWHMSKGQILIATLVAHFAYGIGMGALYGSVEKRVPLPALLRGVVFGIVVWAASYFGLLPLLGLSASGDKEPVQRNLMMLAAHVVWGSAMGATTEVLS